MVVFVRTKSKAGHSIELHIAPESAVSLVHNVKFVKHFPLGRIQVVREVLIGESHVAAFLSAFFSTTFTPSQITEMLVTNQIKEMYNDSRIESDSGH